MLGGLVESIRGISNEHTAVRTKPELPQEQIKQFVAGFQLKATYAMDESPLKGTLMDAMEDDKTGQKRFDLHSGGYIKVIYGSDSNELQVGIFIEGVEVKGKKRSYRLLTHAPKGRGRAEVYFAEYYDDKGKRKPLGTPGVNNDEAKAGADKVLGLALEIASKETKN